VRSQVRVPPRPQKQAILLENKAICSKSEHVADILNSLPRNRGDIFCLNLYGVAKSVAIKMDRTQWFAVEVRNSSHYAPQHSGYKIAHKTHPFFLRYLIDQLMDTRPKCPGALCPMIAILTRVFITISILSYFDFNYFFSENASSIARGRSCYGTAA
jgi:hypothetical protein